MTQNLLFAMVVPLACFLQYVVLVMLDVITRRPRVSKVREGDPKFKLQMSWIGFVLVTPWREIILFNDSSD